MNANIEAEKQFDEFYRLHRPQVTRYVARRLRSDIDDIVEEVFIIAWRKRKLLPPAVSDQTIWLYATAKRVIANKVRWNGRLDRFSRAQEPLIAESANGDSESVTGLMVHSALRQMRPQDREILLLVEWDGYTIDETATMLGVTTSAAGKRIGAARNAFAEKYQK